MYQWQLAVHPSLTHVYLPLVLGHLLCARCSLGQKLGQSVGILTTMSSLSTLWPENRVVVDGGFV